MPTLGRRKGMREDAVKAEPIFWLICLLSIIYTSMWYQSPISKQSKSFPRTALEDQGYVSYVTLNSNKLGRRVEDHFSVPY